MFGLGIYDVKFDGSEKSSYRFGYEYRSEESLFDIGPTEDNFFLKPFFGIEYTNDSASYF